jgi:hypothetical protein
MLLRLKNLSKRQAFLLLVLIFVVLGFIYYYFVWRGHTLVTLPEKNPATIPASELGSWKVYRYHGKIYTYPPNWKLEEFYSENDSKTVSALRFSPPTPANGGDFIGVGGGKSCETMKAALCLGEEPIYTASRTSGTLVVFNSMVQHMND